MKGWAENIVHENNVTSDAMRTQVFSGAQKFRPALDLVVSLSKNWSNVTLGATKETPSPTSGIRFINKWKEVRNEFELIFPCEEENGSEIIAAGKFISNQKDHCLDI